MDILKLAKQERDRLNKVIAMLEPEGETSTPKSHKTQKRKGHEWTAAERKAMSIRQKRIWATKRKAK